MPTITLPDNSTRQFDAPITVQALAADIGAGLAKATLAGRVNGVLVDASYLIAEDAAVSIITAKQPEALEILRHSTAHLLAHAVKQLFPNTQVTIGPVIEDGFFYDFAFERSFTPEDLEKIEARMAELAKQDLPVKRYTLSRDEAIRFFMEQGEAYKAEIIRDIPADEVLSLYQQGDFTDLCRGPHVPSTGKLQTFKLTKVAGAYWRGDSNNPMLQRIYGTAFATPADLKAYLHRLEEAVKRDHRRIGKEQGLFHFQEEAPGMVFWHEKGWAIYLAVEQYIRSVLKESGYQEVKTPQILDRSLWEKSGHWSEFHENMFVTHSEKRDFAIKPMNCPGQIQIFNQGLKSHHDLPIRYAEFGCCHRNEASGALHGLMRVRGFNQDDGHIFCTEEQMQEESGHFIDSLFKVYQAFGFTDVLVKLATRPVKRVGVDALWDKAESALSEALKNKGLEFEVLPGEGAFYGPKIEFHLRDCLGRTWQCGTLQLDFNMPARLGAEYVAADGTRKVPVMLHRAILGALERFIAILIEHYAGILPFWLAPCQAVVMNITDRQADYAQKITQILQKNGFRAQTDLRNEKIGFKIRAHTLQRVPYLLVVGDREAETQTVAVRTQAGEDLGSFSLDAWLERMNTEALLVKQQG